MSPGGASKASLEYPRHPFQLTSEEVLKHLQTDADSGLAPAKAKELQSKYGANKLSGEGGVKWYSVLLKQVSNAMILVLIFAMALSYGVTDWVEGGVITAVIFLNISIGFYQEYNAEKKMDSLRALSSPSANVLRGGHVDTIPSAEVVPGDIVIIKTGDTVPADLRLFEAMNLECDEKILTGEAMPVAKVPDMDFSKDDELQTGIGDRLNMAYSSSTVTKGRGRGVVAFTGMQTEIGRIAESMSGKGTRKPNRSLSSKKHGPMQPVKGVALRTWDGVGKFLGLTEGTPLQIKLSKLAYLLFAFAILLAIIVFGANKFNVTNEVAIYAISTGIAMIPESLIAVLTITFVSGMTQMRKRKVLTRKLSALEALGGITNICSDKTGTLTQGQMVTRKAWIPGYGILTIEGSNDAADPTQGSVRLSADKDEVSADQEKAEAIEQDRAIQFVEPEGRVQRPKPTQTKTNTGQATIPFSELERTPAVDAFLRSSALCNIATVRLNEQEKKWQTTGDPTEIALQVFSSRFEMGKKTLESNGWHQEAEHPFDSNVKRMSVIYSNKDTNEVLIFCKGAVERVLDLCVEVGHGDTKQEMTEDVKADVLRRMDLLAEKGLRVLAIAQRTHTPGRDASENMSREEVEKDLSLLGLAGLYDPPRLETKGAVKECTEAGIKVHMLTGDHPGTAAAIAKEVGIIPRDLSILSKDVADSLVKTASEFDGMSDDEIDAMPELPLVIARCAPHTKTRMIAALHRRGKFAAMTGDGVNDGPSLQAADVGIAMGLAGSDVAKGASDIVLTDDNFASIINAIEEGRRMFDNIQKFVLHLLTTNVGEVVLLICGLGFQDRSGFSVFPLSPLQILWINMVTSGFPAFGLGREKAAYNVMTRPPHNNKKGIFTWQVIADMLVYGALMGILCLLTFVIVIYGPGVDTLGFDCNRSYNDNNPQDTCEVVFRARAAVFAELTWLILITAWEIKSLRRSIVRLDPRKPFGISQIAKDLYENHFLFWSIAIGSVVVFPCIYIPGLNTSVFKHKAITWEWGLSFGAVFIYILGMELWKLAKRSFGWFEEAEAADAMSTEGKEKRTLNLRQGAFSFSRTSSFATGEKEGREDPQVMGVKEATV